MNRIIEAEIKNSIHKMGMAFKSDINLPKIFELMWRFAR